MTLSRQLSQNVGMQKNTEDIVKQLTGLFTALLTPFDTEGNVKESSLRQLVSANIESGVDGFYVCGSTGEAFLLSIEERKQVLSIVMDESCGRAQILCHVGAIGTDLTIELGRDAESKGVDAVSSIPPFYYKFSREEYIHYYLDLADAINLPLIPYNFPALSGVTLTGEMMEILREHRNIIGVKFTSNDLYQLETMRSNDPELIIYNGLDEIFLAGLSMGADGAIGSTFNFMAEKFRHIQNAFGSGDMDRAWKLQHEANEIIRALHATGKLLNAHKYIIEKKGIDFGVCRRPFLPLTTDDKRRIDAAFEHL
jgi:N-acetylneuraminate lyase